MDLEPTGTLNDYIDGQLDVMSLEEAATHVASVEAEMMVLYSPMSDGSGEPVNHRTHHRAAGAGWGDAWAWPASDDWYDDPLFTGHNHESDGDDVPEEEMEGPCPLDLFMVGLENGENVDSLATSDSCTGMRI